MSFTTQTLELLKQAPLPRLRPIFERHDIEPHLGVEALLNEIRLDGGNTLASLFRGNEGVDYDEVVLDVAEKLDVEDPATDPLQLERQILETVVQKYMKEATAQDRAEIKATAAQIASKVHDDAVIEIARKGAFVRLSAPILTELLEAIIIRIISRQATREVGKRAATLAGFAVPLLNVAMLGWTIADISGPAFRKTIPTVIEIALLRLEYSTDVF